MSNHKRSNAIFARNKCRIRVFETTLEPISMNNKSVRFVRNGKIFHLMFYSSLHLIGYEYPFSCSFATKVHLRSHVKGTHERRYHRACPICSKEFNAKRRLLEHLKVHQKNDAEMELKNQIANAEAEIDRLIPNYMDMQCELCQYTFETLSEARSHYRSKHKRHTHLVKCCQLRLKIHGEIRDHIKFHLNPNEFKCVFISCCKQIESK